MDRRQRFWLGLIVLLLAPLMVLAAFALYVYFVNSRPQAGDLQTRVSPQVVSPWGEVAYHFDFAGFKPTPTPPPVSTPTPTPTPVPTPSQIDMVFIVDESSSMTASIGTMASAAQTVVQDLSKERRGRIRYAAIRFDETATTQTDWTDKPDQLAQGLAAIAQTPKGGGTNGQVAFDKLQELLASARPQADKVVIFYTDGLIYPFLFSADNLRETARKLREEQHVDFYSVGLPFQGSDPIMTEITGDPDKVFDPLNPNELARMFQEIKGVVSPTPGTGSGAKPATRTPRDSSGQLSHRLDGRHFATPLEGTNWMPGSGAINLTIRPIPEGPATYAHPLVPSSAGLWTIGLESPRLIFFDKAGQRHQVTGRRPVLLKITYFTLFLMALPALLWSLAHLVPRPRKKEAPRPVEGLKLPPIEPRTFPEPLPLLPRLSLNRLPPIPTLFVGLGGAGRRALHAVRADLKQSHLSGAGQPYQFLWVDTDTQEAERKLQFEDWEGYDIAESIPSPAVRQTADYLPETTDDLQHLQWFNPNLYRNAQRARLNLTDGAKGERPLARLALFKWLSDAEGVLPQLIQHVKALTTSPATDGQRQIVIFASADGGIGTGWFLDFGRLMQRIARQENTNTGEVLPDVIGVLCEGSVSRHPENKSALMKELETALTTRKFPLRVTYAAGEGLLDQVEAQSPYHWVFNVTAGDEPSVAAQAGALASVLVERHPRAGLLDLAQNFPQGRAVAIQTFGAHVLPTLIFDQVRCELFLSLLGHDVLLDVVPNAQGGLKPAVVDADKPGQLLDDWSRAEQTGTPLKLLLQAAVNPAAVSGFVTLIQNTPDARKWFGDAFSIAVSKQLQGHAVGDSGWERGWKPSEAIATLHLLSAGLSYNVIPELSKPDAVQITEIVNDTISRADSAANDLERWVDDFCRVLERIAAQQSQLDQARRNLLRLESRTYIDLQVTSKQVKEWAKEGLESWLGTPDTVSAIRQRLFFEITANGSGVSTTVQSFIAKEPKSFASAEEVATEIDQFARTLALNVPTVRIGGVLLEMSNERRLEVAHDLVRIENQPPQVLLVLPKTMGLLPEEQKAIEAFGPIIPNPPSHGPRTQQQGDDHSAVRRLELAEAFPEHGTTASEALPFVEMPESIAEAVRHRAEKKYKLALPVFPPQLRIALAYPKAFRSFAHAYKAGQIMLRQDDNGSMQWSIAATGQFLTFGSESSLAHAAANYVRDIENYPELFKVAGEGGNFSKLEQWIAESAVPDHDTLTQIAVAVYEV